MNFIIHLFFVFCFRSAPEEANANKNIRTANSGWIRMYWLEWYADEPPPSRALDNFFNYSLVDGTGSFILLVRRIKMLLYLGRDRRPSSGYGRR